MSELLEQNEAVVPDADLNISIAKLGELSDDDLMLLARERMATEDITQKTEQSILSALGEADAELSVDYNKTTEELEQFDHLKNLYQDGRLLVARNGQNQIQGAIGLIEKKKYQSKDGQHYWMVTAAVVPRSLRGKGIYRQLAAAVYTEIQTRAPGAPVFRMTKNPLLIKSWEKAEGWRKIEIDHPTNELAALRMADRGMEETEEFKKEGYVYFVHLPSTARASAA